ncbi:3-hydroxyacyl-CoA dehydrogenase [Amycolatopsis orientalis]|uniref:3-hydroxyacyl-CoA dehydrogenase n=1 Tax=Amycolatopsis orientalis TaxID=31958 RepID=A0A193BUF6_AMYOR|nr:3-hydroxyacyl-CoA dehydrogenase NAD-binding domain-containing protein [Amycolatopsis orientalis]ANN15847.1 3-hydroxyacyl-CoA dehydrogenase [Amycolatopsis orientalis]
MIECKQGADGIVVLTMDDPIRGANMMNKRYRESMGAVVTRLETEKDSITGVVLTSAKRSFFAGADLAGLLTATRADARRVFDEVEEVKAQLRRLERLGRPVVCAINGSALGGGLEIALATQYRVVANVPGVRLGLPEISLGLMPGAGGVARITRMLGVQRGVELLSRNTRLGPAEALQLGLVDELVDSVDDLLPAAKRWIVAHPEGQAAPWDLDDHVIPGGRPDEPELATTLPALAANLRRQLKGAPLPAPRAILAAAVEGVQVGFDDASTIESRYFTELACGRVSTNMIQAFFFDLQEINTGASRPVGLERTTFHRVAVLGAGMMGAAIAYLCAKAGMEVVLKDVTIEAAQRGKEHAGQIAAKALKHERSPQERSEEVLARILPTADVADLADADLVIEAVFESEELKRQVFREVEDVVHPMALLGSNTSTLPISSLARGVKRQQDFIGIHFFSPAEKMPLVEIIRAEQTSDAALAKAFDLVQAIGKTPIVVKDGRGFFTSRVISTFLYEALGMLVEGVEPATIEQAALQAGYPAGPLQLLDELTLPLMRKIRKETHDAVRKAGGVPPDDGAGVVLKTMVDVLGRPSKAAGAGFYDYVDGRRTRLWPGLRGAFGTSHSAPPLGDLIDRLLFIEAIETQKCFDEGILCSTADANIGSIYGIGYPAWTGGVHQFVVGHEGGPAGFVARADELAKQYGERFAAPDSLR